MHFNSRIRAGCLAGSASKTLVCPFLSASFSLAQWFFTFTMKLSELMMCLNVLGQPILVINSLKTAAELLNWCANIYSNHPYYIVTDEIPCGGLFTAFMSYRDVGMPFILRIQNLSLLLVGGIVLTMQHMRSSPRWSFAIITQFFAKRQPSLLPQCSKAHKVFIDDLVLLDLLSSLIANLLHI